MGSYLYGIDVLCKTVKIREMWKIVEITFEVGISFVQPILTAVEPWLMQRFRGSCVQDALSVMELMFRANR